MKGAMMVAATTSPIPRGNRVLLRGGFLVTVDETLGEFTGDILMQDGKIAMVAPTISAGDCEIVEAAAFFILPGFVDCHRHLWQTPLRHTGSDWDLPRMFAELFIEFGPKFRPEDIYATTLFGRLMALDAGVTTLLDWAHIQNTPEHSDEAVRALRDAGGRSIFGHGQPGNDPKPWMVNSSLPHPGDIRRVREKLLPSDDALVTLAMAARGPEFCTMDVVEHDMKLARELGLRVTMHIGMGEAGAKNHAIERMHERHLLGPDLTCLHCCTSSDHEFKLLADTGTTVSVSALMAMLANGFGLPATGRLMAQGVRPSLSADSEMTASGDMFTEMRAALAAERAIRNNRIPNGPPRAMITARDVLSFATIEGARAVGLAAKIGSITPGKRADLILIRRDSLNLAPAIDPIGSLVIGGHCGNVEAVFVDGKAVKWDGEMVCTDVGRARNLLAKSCTYLYDRAVRHAETPRSN
jgi:5-methylthioadenosine/S-adenosylhomocysteine deaminase